MTNNTKYILLVIIASAIVLGVQISFAQEDAEAFPFPEGKASSVSVSPTPEMIAEQEKQQAEFLKKENISSGSQIVAQETNPSQYPPTLAEKVSMLGYAVFAGFVWLIGITVTLFKKHD